MPRSARPSLGDPALRPALRPAFKVRRGRRSTCAAMCRHAPPIRRGAPRDFRSACRRTGQGSWFLNGSRLSPQRTPLVVCPSGNEGLNLFMSGGRSNGEIYRVSLKSHNLAAIAVMGSISVLGGSRRFQKIPAVLLPRAVFRCQNFPKFSLFAFSFSRFCDFGFCKKICRRARSRRGTWHAVHAPYRPRHPESGY